MILLNQNQDNEVILTLSESVFLTGITSSGFTMTLTHKDTDEVWSGITLTDTSSYPIRYNSFNITLSGSSSQDFLTATLYLPNNGFYEYSCYYINDAETELLENGLCYVQGGSIISYNVINTNDISDYTTY